MRESDARKDGGTYGEHTTQYDEDRYQDEPEGKREDPVCPNCGQWQNNDGDCFNECAKRGFVNKGQAQAAPAHTPRTDERTYLPNERDNLTGDIVSADFARELERELAETRAACDALAEALRDIINFGGTRQAIVCRASLALAQWEEAKK